MRPFYLSIVFFLCTFLNIKGQSLSNKWFNKLLQENSNSNVIKAITFQHSGTFVLGHLIAGVDLDPSAAEATAYSPNPFGYYLAYYDLNGNYQWHTTISSFSSTALYNVDLDWSGSGVPILLGVSNDTFTYHYKDFQGNIVSTNYNAPSAQPKAVLIRLNLRDGYPAVNVQPLNDELLNFSLITYDLSFFSFGNYMLSNLKKGLKIMSGNSMELMTLNESSAKIVNGNGNISISKTSIYNLGLGYNVLTLGSFDGTIDFDPGAGSYQLSSAQSSTFIASYRPDGNFNWVVQSPVNETWLQIKNGYQSVYIHCRNNLNQEYIKKLDLNTRQLTLSIQVPSFEHFTISNNKIYLSDGISVIRVISEDGTLLASNTLQNISSIDGLQVIDNKLLAYGKFDNTAASQIGARTLVDKGSYFGLYDITSTPLSIVFKKFYMEQNNNTQKLIWQIDTNEGIESFEIQKSINGKLWQAIGSISGGPFTKNFETYTFEDQNNTDDLAYYRIRAISKGGRDTYSKILNTYPEQKKAISIYPNPAHTELMVSVADVASASEVEIYSNLGQLLHKQKLVSKNTKIPLQSYSTGIYFYRIVGTSTVKEGKFVVTK